MGEERFERSWDSVCSECIHFGQSLCQVGQRAADPQDSIAAVCGDFEGREKQNYISDRVE